MAEKDMSSSFKLIKELTEISTEDLPVYVDSSEWGLVSIYDIEIQEKIAVTYRSFSVPKNQYKTLPNFVVGFFDEIQLLKMQQNPNRFEIEKIEKIKIIVLDAG